jgi:ribonuclease Z
MAARTILRALSGLLFLLAALPLQAQEIEVTLLGTGRPDPIIERFGPSILVRAGGETLVFDAGRGATQRLWQLGIPLSQVSGLFLTHLHSDHVVGIPDLWLTSWLPTPYGKRATPLQVWGPEGTHAMMTALRQAFAWDIDRRGRGEGLPMAAVAVDAHDITEGVVFDRNGVRVTAFLVDHGGLLEPAYGYRVDYAGRSVVLSGDTRPSDNLARFAEGVDLIIHEVIAARPELLEKSEDARRIVGFHTLPEDAGRIFEKARPRLAVYSHIVLLTTDPAISAQTVEELIPRTQTTYAGAVVVGEDLMTIVVAEQVEVHRFRPKA